MQKAAKLSRDVTEREERVCVCVCGGKWMRDGGDATNENVYLYVYFTYILLICSVVYGDSALISG